MLGDDLEFLQYDYTQSLRLNSCGRHRWSCNWSDFDIASWSWSVSCKYILLALLYSAALSHSCIEQQLSYLQSQQRVTHEQIRTCSGRHVFLEPVLVFQTKSGLCRYHLWLTAAVKQLYQSCHVGLTRCHIISHIMISSSDHQNNPWQSWQSLEIWPRVHICMHDFPAGHVKSYRRMRRAERHNTPWHAD